MRHGMICKMLGLLGRRNRKISEIRSEGLSVIEVTVAVNCIHTMMVKFSVSSTVHVRAKPSGDIHVNPGSTTLIPTIAT